MQGMPRSAALASLLAQPIDAPAADAGEGTDRLLAIASVADEQGPDEVGRVEPVLGKHRAHPCAATGRGACEEQGKEADMRRL